ncbi:HlyD family secretion protein [Polystyrenella longa]|uniref:HlyD family secretion protein n=1 Tax=Polystyrenella longa TaxID=2528007 RepID=A0A518CK01_9PLAN|nr:HlyD family secretion protein [Polystyrenella longa]QDU79551.1 HlyD family secretion protein [Polystyrenella longa]
MTDKTPRPENQIESTLPSRPAPLGRTVLLASLVFGVVLSGVIYLKNRDAVAYTGYLQANAVAIKAPFTARMERLLVEEGEAVVPEVPLFSLMDDKLERRKDSKQRQIAVLRSELERAQAEAKIEIADRMNKIENELLETKLKSANLLKEQFAYEMEDIAWSEYSDSSIEVASLQRSPGTDYPITPANDNERKIEILLRRAAMQNANEVITSQVELCQRRMRELEDQKQNLPKVVEVSVGVESLQSKLNEEEREYRELLNQLQEQEVRSPGYGLIGLFEAQLGETVEEGDLIVSLYDQEQLYVTVDIPSHDVHRYQREEKLKLSFPDGTHSRGRIVKIAPHVTSPEHQDATPSRQTLVRLWLEPADALWPAAPIGSQIEITR